MRKICLILFLIGLIYPAFTQSREGESTSSFRFIENKNQWDSRVLFKSDIPSGAIFLEKNAFTYHMRDGSLRANLHQNKSHKKDSLKGHAFKVMFQGANPQPTISANRPFSDYYNFFIGKDPSKWASNVQAYQLINYQELYPGVDLQLYSSGNYLKYDFIILPGGDVSEIKLVYQGVEKILLSEGNLVLKTSVGDIIEERPYAYQIINGRKISIPCYYILNGSELSYSFPNGYDKTQKLTIDPTLIFSTYSGSFVDNFGYTATHDSEGFLYSGSTAFGIGYPTTLGAYQTSFGGGTVPYYESGTDIAITKFDTSGTKRIYSTYLGGSRDEIPHSLIADNNDNLIIFGTTSSANFPTTQGAYDNTFASGDSIIFLSGIAVEYNPGTDIFISKLNQNGSALTASTYLGGSANDGIMALSTIDHVDVYYFPPYYYYDTTYRTSPLRYNYADELRGEVEIDKDNNIYITSCTKSSDFPIVGASYQSAFAGGNFDAIAVKLNSDLTNIIWSSFLGGSKDDAGYSLEIDSLNNVYVCGGTNSTNFPASAGKIYPTAQGGRADGFIACFDNNGTSLLYSTYFGTSKYDQTYLMSLDSRQNVYVFGQTEYSNTINPLQNPFIYNAGFYQTNSGQFISKLNPGLDSLIWSTTFGTGSGRPNISPTAFTVDLCSKIYLSGWGGTPENDAFLNGINYPFNMLTTLGPNLPTDFYQPTTDGYDFYLFVLEDDASAVHYASFFGGIESDEHVDGGTSRFDKKGKIYQAMCAGCGQHSDMPLEPPYGFTELPSHNNSTNCNLGVFKMDFRLPAVIADFSADPGCIGDTVKFINNSLTKSATTFQWKFGDGGTSTATNPSHIYSSGGTYDVTLIVSDNATCNLADTLTKTIYISPLTSGILSAYPDQDTIYKGKSTTVHAVPPTGYIYAWMPAGSLSNPAIPNPVATPDTTTTYTVYASDIQVPKCSVQAKVKVTVIELECAEPRIYIPDAFTPDGDGQNERIYVRSKVIKDFFFTIYNRWGEKVFETSDQNVGWDGTYKGMKADPGVFVYYLEATCLDDQKFFKKGNITLIR